MQIPMRRSSVKGSTSASKSERTGSNPLRRANMVAIVQRLEYWVVSPGIRFQDPLATLYRRG